jgi:uncharacterized membrane protein YesL
MPDYPSHIADFPLSHEQFDDRVLVLKHRLKTYRKLCIASSIIFPILVVVFLALIFALQLYYIVPVLAPLILISGLSPIISLNYMRSKLLSAINGWNVEDIRRGLHWSMQAEMKWSNYKLSIILSQQ